MKASIIIPVWNGSSVISDCLQTLYSDSGEELFEVICLDNASSDDSSTQIENAFPQVRLIHLPVNLGFAGSVNKGINAAQGDVFFLLNQDCLVQPGWLTALTQALRQYPQSGIFGCTIYNNDGTVNHTGAEIRHPDASGIHITDIDEELVHNVDFVTGAAIAIRRSTWDVVGRFDEGFYPAYYEDADYCYRARSKGIETVCATTASVKHLFSSNEWKKNPTKHTSSGYISRYRFICKHFDEKEISEFIESEIESLNKIGYLDHAIGRVIAARYTLHSLPEILERRQSDLGDVLSATVDRQLQVGFTYIMQQGFRTSEKLVAPTVAAASLPETPKEFESVQISVGQLQKFDLGELNLATLPDTSDWDKSWKNNAESLQEIRYSEHDLLARIHFRSPSDPMSEGTLQRLYRLLFKRLPSLLAGREDLLWSELNNVREERIKQLIHRIELSAQLSQIYRKHMDLSQQVEQIHKQLNERLKLLEILTEYDYR